MADDNKKDDVLEVDEIITPERTWPSQNGAWRSYPWWETPLIREKNGVRYNVALEGTTTNVYRPSNVILEDCLSTHDTKIADIYTKLTALTNAFNEFMTGSPDNNNTIDKISELLEYIDAHEPILQTINNHLTLLDSQVASLNTRVTKNEGDITTLFGNIDYLDGRVDTTNGKVETNRLNIAANATRLDGHDEDISEIRGNISDINTFISQVDVKADNAVSTANNAQTAAQAAQSLAQAANTMAEEAFTRASNAGENSVEALQLATQANSNAIAANQNAATALSQVDAALAEAQQAITSANQVSQLATEAHNASNDAILRVIDAEGKITVFENKLATYEEEHTKSYNKAVEALDTANSVKSSLTQYHKYKRCVTGNNTSTVYSPCWKKVASVVMTVALTNRIAVFLVKSTFRQGGFTGLLSVKTRVSSTLGQADTSLTNFNWLVVSSTLDVNNYALCYLNEVGTQCTFEIWVNVTEDYDVLTFDLLTESSRTGFIDDGWTVYTNISGAETSLPTGYSVIYSECPNQLTKLLLPTMSSYYVNGPDNAPIKFTGGTLTGYKGLLTIQTSYGYFTLSVYNKQMQIIFISNDNYNNGVNTVNKIDFTMEGLIGLNKTPDLSLNDTEVPTTAWVKSLFDEEKKCLTGNTLSTTYSSCWKKALATTITTASTSHDVVLLVKSTFARRDFVGILNIKTRTNDPIVVGKNNIAINWLTASSVLDPDLFALCYKQNTDNSCTFELWVNTTLSWDIFSIKVLTENTVFDYNKNWTLYTNVASVLSTLPSGYTVVYSSKPVMSGSSQMLGTDTVGSVTNPIYLSNGTPTTTNSLNNYKRVNRCFTGNNGSAVSSGWKKFASIVITETTIIRGCIIFVKSLFTTSSYTGILNVQVRTYGSNINAHVAYCYCNWLSATDVLDTSKFALCYLNNDGVNCTFELWANMTGQNEICGIDILLETDRQGFFTGNVWTIYNNRTSAVTSLPSGYGVIYSTKPTMLGASQTLGTSTVGSTNTPIYLNGGAPATATALSDYFIPWRRGYVGNDGNTAYDTCWKKAVSHTLTNIATTSSVNRNVVLLIKGAYKQSKFVGILNVTCRFYKTVVGDACKINWSVATSDLVPGRFALCYQNTSSTSCVFEIWINCVSTYDILTVEALTETSNGGYARGWTFYNNTTSASSSLPSGYTVVYSTKPETSGWIETAGVSTKLGTSTVGSTTQPVYIASGTPTVCNSLSNYVTTSSLSTTLGSYVTTSSLNTTLGSYVTTSSLSTTLSSYVTSSSLNTTLGSYVTSSALSSTLSGYKLLKRCAVGNNSSTAYATCWKKCFAVVTTAEYKRSNIIVLVQSLYQYSGFAGILHVTTRSKTLGTVEEGQTKCYWLTASGNLNPNNFALCYLENSGTSVSFELWINTVLAYDVFSFTMLTESHRSGFENVWTFYTSGTGASSSLPSGYTVVYSTKPTISGSTLDITGPINFHYNNATNTTATISEASSSTINIGSYLTAGGYSPILIKNTTVSSAITTGNEPTYGNYIHFTNGLLIQWGSGSQKNSAGYSQINFPKSFYSIDRYTVVVAPMFANYTKGIGCIKQNASYFYVYGETNLNCTWIAVGYSTAA